MQILILIPDPRTGNGNGRYGRRPPFLVTMIACLTCIIAVTVAQIKPDISRVSYGVNFEYITKSDVIVHYWHHTFMFPIPVFPKLNSSQIEIMMNPWTTGEGPGKMCPRYVLDELQKNPNKKIEIRDRLNFYLCNNLI